MCYNKYISHSDLAVLSKSDKGKISLYVGFPGSIINTLDIINRAQCGHL